MLAKKSRPKTGFIVFFSVLLSLTVLVFGFSAVVVPAATAPMTQKNILLFCLDETGYNTDAVLLVSMSQSGEMTLLQVPRDTYVDTGSEHHKINHLYYRYFSESKDKKEAARRFADFFEGSFGIAVHNTVLLELSAVEALIDAIGGVTLTLPEALSYRDPAQNLTIELPAGTQKLSGKDAVAFARYRQGYVTGDIGRLDAQKLLLSAIYRRLCTPMQADAIFRIASTFLTRAKTDLTLSDLLSIGSFFAIKNTSLRVSYVTLPGEASRYNKDSGIWYYAVNRGAAAEVLSRAFGGDEKAFDPTQLFCGKSDVMRNIYFADHYSYITYTEETVDHIKIPFIK